MLTIILITVLCVLVLNYLSKMLSSHLAHEKASLANERKTIMCPPKASTTGFRPGQKLSLLDLPAEIRLQIYSLCLPTSHPYILGRDYGHSTSYFAYPNLLHTNQQLRRETLPLFFKGNTFIVDVHAFKDLKAFLKWLRLIAGVGKGAKAGDVVKSMTYDERREIGAFLGAARDMRITVGGCLLVEVVPKTGRRRYGDARVVATKPYLNNSLKWDRKNILHYVQDFEKVTPMIEDLLRDVEAKGPEDTGLRIRHLVGLVGLMIEIRKLDGLSRSIYHALVEAVGV